MKEKLKISAYDEYLNFAQKITHSYISALLFLLPLAITNAYYNITETKLFVFYGLSGAYIVAQSILFLFFATSKKAAFIKSLSFKLNFVDVAFILFGLSYVISSLVSAFGVNDVLLGIGSRYQGALTIALYAIIYFIITRTFSFSPMCLVWAGVGFSIVAVIAVLNGFSIDVLGIYSELSQKDKGRFISTIGNINFFSAYFNLLLPPIVVGFCKAVDKKTTGIFGAFVVAGALGLVFTASESFLLGFAISMLLLLAVLLTDTKALKRFVVVATLFILSMVLYVNVYNSGWLGDSLNYKPSALMTVISKPFICVALIVILFSIFIVASTKPSVLRGFKKVYIVILVVGFVTSVVGLVLINTAFKHIDLGQFNKFLKFSASWGTWRGRNWAFCVDLFMDAPIINKLIGFGPETYHHFTEKTDFYKSLSLDQAHNEYLQYLISVGILGLVSYLCVILGTVKKCFGKLIANPVAISILCGLVAYWLQASVNIAQPITTPIMFIFIAVLSKLSTTSSIEPKNI